MSKKDDKYLTLEDRLIWSAYVEQENINHLQNDDFANFEDLLASENSQDAVIKSAPVQKTFGINKKQVNKSVQSFEIDRRTEEKLRKGKMPIEARCDLHGLNQIEAHDLLKKFIHTAVSKGCRCVLVITGKGKSRISTKAVIEPEQGILKQKVPQWLHNADIRYYILKSYSAQPKHGGSGALYVYLRRNRR